GDWQITDWLFPSVRNESGQRVKNPLPFSERWKILDNLRRSLLPLTTVLLIVAGWIGLPGSALVWTFIALFPLVVPNLISVAAEIGDHPPGETWQVYADVLLTENELGLKRGFCQVAFVLFEAALSVDAI